MTAVLVAVAGAAGVLARYGIARATAHSEALIWSTVAINVAGSFLLGLWSLRLVLARRRDVIGIGFLAASHLLHVLGADRDRGSTAAAGRAYLYVCVGGIAAAWR